MLFQNFPFHYYYYFFFTWASSRGAFAPKNSNQHKYWKKNRTNIWVGKEFRFGQGQYQSLNPIPCGEEWGQKCLQTCKPGCNNNITNKTEVWSVQLGNTLILIGSLTPKIFLIVTNVAGTNVAWTNVTMTVEICSSHR